MYLFCFFFWLMYSSFFSWLTHLIFFYWFDCFTPTPNIFTWLCTSWLLTFFDRCRTLCCGILLSKNNHFQGDSENFFASKLIWFHSKCIEDFCLLSFLFSLIHFLDFMLFYVILCLFMLFSFSIFNLLQRYDFFKSRFPWN